MNRARPVAAVVVAITLAAASCTASGSPQIGVFSAAPQPEVTIRPTGCSGIPLRAGRASDGVPDVRLTCLGPGANLSLAYLRGPALVNIWGSWCQACVDELPVLATFAALNPSVTVIGVDIGDRRAAPAVAELSVARVRYPNLVDFDGKTRAAGAGVVPTTYFVDSAGRIVFRNLNPYTNVGRLRADVRAHLGFATS